MADDKDTTQEAAKNDAQQSTADTDGTANANNEGTENTEGAAGNEGAEKSSERTFTQEELDEIISKRLEKAREGVRKEYADYDRLKEIAEKYEDLEKNYNDITDKYSGVAAERDRLKVAREYDFGEEALELVVGTNYEELKESAEKVKKLLDSQEPALRAGAGSFKPKEYTKPEPKDPYLAKAQEYFRNK